MKHILFIILLIFNLLFLSNCYLNDKKEFIKKVNNYSNYNPILLDEYYELYTSNNNIEYSLNKINYPHFLTPAAYNNQAININNILLVNKSFYLNKEYINNNLVKVENIPHIKRENEEMLINKETLINYQNLYLYINSLGYNIYIFSAYRSYEKQKKIYENAVNKEYVAEEGYSEHQTGYAIDISLLDIGLTNHLENTDFYNILINNLHQYGFILRYPKDKTHITGYPFEPWHIRYVGKDIAERMYNENICLEEYFYLYLPLNF